MKASFRFARCIVACALVLGMMPVASFAEETTPTDGSVNTAASAAAEEEAVQPAPAEAPAATEAPLSNDAAIMPLSGVQEGPQILEEGDFGEDDALHWAYRDDASLTISGNGAIPDYTEDGGQPWNAYLRTIETLSIEEGATEVGAYAFYECRLITEASLPDSLVRIGDYGFYCNENVVDFNISDDIETIGSHAFHGCLRYRSFKAPSKLTELSDYVFAQCGKAYGSFTNFSIELHAGITHIGAHALDSCSFASLELPAGLESIGSGAFMLMSVNGDFTMPALKQTPSYLGYYTVRGTLHLSDGMATATANQVVSTCDCLYLSIPASLERFTYAPPSNMPASVEKGFIVDPDNSSFIVQDDCLFSCYYEDTEYESKAAVLCACPSTKRSDDYAIPEGTRIVLSLPACKNLSVPASVEQLPSLGNITEWVEVSQDNEWYASCDGILYTGDMKRLIRCPRSYSRNPHVKIPTGVEELDSRAFYYCEKIAGVSLPEGIESIPDSCFYGCESLAAVFVPRSVKNVSIFAFWSISDEGRHGLNVFYRGDPDEWNAISIGLHCEAFSSSRRFYQVKSFGICPDQLLYHIDEDDVLHVEPDVQLDDPSVQMMDYTATLAPWLEANEFFTGVEFDQSIEKVSNGAFANCESLESVVLHRAISSVGSRSFANCPKLIAVKCQGGPPSAIAATQPDASFDVDTVTIAYSRGDARWLEVIDASQSVPTWQGYVVGDYEPDDLPRIGSAQLVKSGKPLTELTVVGDPGYYVDDQEVEVHVNDESGSSLAGRVDVEVVVPDRKRPLGEPWKSGQHEPYYDAAAGMIKVPSESPAGDYQVTINPRPYESEGDPLILSFHVTRLNENGCLLVFNGTNIASDATRTLKAYGHYTDSDHEASIDVCNRYYETVYAECDVRVIDVLNNEDVTSRTEELGFTVPDDPAQKITVNNMAQDRTYAITCTYKDAAYAGKTVLNLRIERESKLMNAPYSLTLKGEGETIELDDESQWSSTPLRVRALDGFDDPCWPDLSWTVQDAQGNDVAAFFQVDEQGYIKVDPALRGSLDGSGSPSAFIIRAHADGVEGYDAQKDAADLTSRMRTSNELSFWIKVKQPDPVPVTHVATFKVGDEVIGQVTFAEGDASLETPIMPSKANYLGTWKMEDGTAWDDFDLASAKTDLTVIGEYAPLNPDEVSDITTSGDAEYKDGAVTVNLQASASSRNVRVESSTTKPVDVVLVCDQSGSMEDELGGGQSKEAALKACANSFANSLFENAKKTGADHRIALVGFASSTSSIPNYENTGLIATNTSGAFKGYRQLKNADYANALMPINVNGSVNARVMSGISLITYGGATAADLGLGMAKNIFANNPIGEGAQAGERERIVLFITDGTPTGFNTDARYANSVSTTAAGAITEARYIKQSQGARIYSIGVEAGANASADDLYGAQGQEVKSGTVYFDFNRFLHLVSSNYPAATSMSNKGLGSQSDGYYMPVTNTSVLDSIFTTILYSSVYTVETFERATIRYQVPSGLSLTLKQEEEMRADLEAQGVSSSDISVVREDGTTTITFSNVPVKRVLKDGVPEYVAAVSFKLSAEANVAGGVGMGSFEADCMGDVSEGVIASVSIPQDRCAVVFLLDGQPYEIRDLEQGDLIEIPDTDLARWMSLEKLTDEQRRASGTSVVFETTSLSRTYALRWIVEGHEQIEHLAPGAKVVAPDVSDLVPEGYELAGWVPAPPLSMPSESVTCTAVITKSHEHAYTASSYKTGSCTEGMIVHDVCACGEEQTYQEAAKSAHAFVTALSADGTYANSTTKLICKECGYSVEKDMEYEVAVEDDEVTVFDLTKLESEVAKPGESADDIEIQYFLGVEDGAEYTVTRIDEDDTRTEYGSSVRDGYLCFSPDHFSIYVIGAKDASGASAAADVDYAGSLERLQRAAADAPAVTDPPTEGGGSGDDGSGGGSGDGSGGDEAGNGDGTGDGDGNGAGAGTGDGATSGGNNSGNSPGTGPGSGSDTGSGNGSSDGSGSGTGAGSGSGEVSGTDEGVGTGAGNGIGAGNGSASDDGTGANEGSAAGDGTGSSSGSSSGEGAGPQGEAGAGTGMGSSDGQTESEGIRNVTEVQGNALAQTGDDAIAPIAGLGVGAVAALAFLMIAFRRLKKAKQL